MKTINNPRPDRTDVERFSELVGILQADVHTYHDKHIKALSNLRDAEERLRYAQMIEDDERQVDENRDNLTETYKICMDKLMSGKCQTMCHECGLAMPIEVYKAFRTIDKYILEE